MICKARLVARGFEKAGKNMEKVAHTCAPETLKLSVVKNIQG